jgi:hypothetical protein
MIAGESCPAAWQACGLQLLLRAHATHMRDGDYVLAVDVVEDEKAKRGARAAGAAIAARTTSSR